MKKDPQKIYLKLIIYTNLLASYNSIFNVLFNNIDINFNKYG